jgi:hypothetical protein
MSLLSTASEVEEESYAEECFSSEEQPARETNANAARQEKIKFLII